SSISPKRASGLGRDHDTVEVIGAPIELERSADVEAEIRRRLLQDFVRRNGYPGAVDLHLVVAADLSSRGRTAIGEAAARTFGVGALQGLVEAVMPRVMAVPEIAILRHGRGGPEQRKHNAHGRDEPHGGAPSAMRPLPAQ